MKEHPNFPWDFHSNQPHVIRNKWLKRRIYIAALGQFTKSALLLPLVPFLMLYTLRWKKPRLGKVDQLMGLSIHVEETVENTLNVPNQVLSEMVDDIGVQQVLVRIPLADVANLEKYIQHIDLFLAEGREITVNILQCRHLLDDLSEMEKAIETVIESIHHKVHFISVGNAYNRRKWAFKHFGEYHRFYRMVRKIVRAKAPHMKLIGGNVIDFEIIPFLESLLHFRPGAYDAYGAQLYVDRRGAPENTQIGFDFLRKVNFIDTIIQLSSKASGKLWITEINWPLKGAGEFAPCYGSALVDEISHANYLARTYLLAMASGRVRTCFWHQLVAPGYGLVDNRGEEIRKRPAYHAFKTLCLLMRNAQITKFYEGGYRGKSNIWAVEALTLIDDEKAQLVAFWSIYEDVELQKEKGYTYLNQSGEEVSKEDLLLGSSAVTYGFRLHHTTD